MDPNHLLLLAALAPAAYAVKAVADAIAKVMIVKTIVHGAEPADRPEIIRSAVPMVAPGHEPRAAELLPLPPPRHAGQT